MSLKSKFLTLSIKEQICLTIISLSFFCLLAVFCICVSLSYEFFKEDYKFKKLYFFNRYKDYIESSFYFQNICLLQYEDIIKYIQKLSYEHYQKLNYYNLTNFENYTEHVISYNDSIHKYIQSGTDRENPELYMLCFWEPGDSSDQYKFVPTDIFCPTLKIIVLDNYQSSVNSYVFHDINDSFRIPGYDVPIVNSALFANVNYSSIYSFNASKIHNKLMEIQGNTTHISHDILRNYFHSTFEEIVLSLQNNDIIYYLSKNFERLEHMHYKISKFSVIF
jgi:hypothetical protein